MAKKLLGSIMKKPAPIMKKPTLVHEPKAKIQMPKLKTLDLAMKSFKKAGK